MYCLEIDFSLYNEILKPYKIILAFYRQTNSIIQAKFSKTFPFKCQDLGCTGLVWPEYRKGPVISKTMQISVFCKNKRLFSYSSFSCHCFSWPQDTRNIKINTVCLISFLYQRYLYIFDQEGSLENCPKILCNLFQVCITLKCMEIWYVASDLFP